MRWLTLYLRTRGAPLALAGAAGCVALMWTTWSISSDTPDADLQLVVLTLLLMVVAVTATLGGPDDALESTAAFSWLPRRLAHLLAGFLFVAGLLLITLLTGARFGPGWLVVRDVAGLLGMTALGAATLGTARAWFLPLGWTLVAILFGQDTNLLWRVLTWQMQAPQSVPAAVTAGVLAIGGLIAYTVAGPVRAAPAEAAQH
ncbi:hypothetical protein [Actinoplanes sp. DH11]|uniref:hypothetical protein n=1 Tax=Actinoplanes sp. DH11 TaxID=2857011 RepID=UPI001E464A68|nr:hypothetical protein [Actinoplanes sp. DH11]